MATFTFTALDGTHNTGNGAVCDRVTYKLAVAGTGTLTAGTATMIVPTGVTNVRVLGQVISTSTTAAIGVTVSNLVTITDGTDNYSHTVLLAAGSATPGTDGTATFVAATTIQPLLSNVLHLGFTAAATDDVVTCHLAFSFYSPVGG